MAKDLQGLLNDIFDSTNNALRVSSTGSSAALEDWVSLGNLGATETITGTDDQIDRAYGTLDQNCTITVTLSANQQHELVLSQDGTGGRTVSWSGVTIWVTSDGAAPVLNAAASALNRFYFENVNGTTYGWFLNENAGVLKSLVDAKGDILAATAADTITRVAVGTDGQTVIANAGSTPGLKWVSAERTLVAIIDGGGSAITTGAKKAYVDVPIDCTITKARLLADQSGSIVVDIWKDTYANYPPTVADTITASAKPTLSSAIKSEDSTLTGWTKDLTAGDVLEFNVDSASTVTKVRVVLFVKPR